MLSNNRKLELINLTFNTQYRRLHIAQQSNGAEEAIFLSELHTQLVMDLSNEPANEPYDEPGDEPDFQLVGHPADEFVAIYGERNRTKIERAMGFLDDAREKWALSEPLDTGQFLAALLGPKE